MKKYTAILLGTMMVIISCFGCFNSYVRITQEEALSYAEQKFNIASWYNIRLFNMGLPSGAVTTDEDLLYYLDNISMFGSDHGSSNAAYGVDKNGNEKLVYYTIKYRNTADKDKMFVAKDYTSIFTHSAMSEFLLSITDAQLKETLWTQFANNKYFMYPIDIFKLWPTKLANDFLLKLEIDKQRYDICYWFDHSMLFAFDNTIYVCREEYSREGVYDTKIIYPIEKTYDEFFADYVA